MKEETKLKLIGVLSELLSELKGTGATGETKEETINYKEDKGGGLVDIDWSVFPVGTKFTGTIEDVFVWGRIQKQDEAIFLCQDNKRGFGCADKLGHRHSWSIGGGSNFDLDNNNVRIFSLELDPDFVVYVPEVVTLSEGYDATIYPGYIEVGCQEIPNAVVREVASKLVEKVKS